MHFKLRLSDTDNPVPILIIDVYFRSSSSCRVPFACLTALFSAPHVPRPYFRSPPNPSLFEAFQSSSLLEKILLHGAATTLPIFSILLGIALS